MQLDISTEFGSDIQKGMIGLFFEDINYGLDGGLHAEMIENRSFEFVQTKGSKGFYEESFTGLYGWSAYPTLENGGTIEIQTIDPLNKVNPHYLVFTAQASQCGFTNKAYDGIYMKKDLNYYVSFYARVEDYSGDIEVIIEKDNEIVAYQVVTKSVQRGWAKYEVSIRSEVSVSCGSFVIRLTEPGTVSFDFISMIPSDAVFGVFRKDLVDLLQDMKPGFLRFPGGCIIEGYSLKNRYQWKKSIGKAEERQANSSRWALHGTNEENQFISPYSYYNQTLGIGFYEYFMLCEYLGAKPIPVVNVGLACQFQSTELVSVHDHEFEEYISDAVDLIEFANGPVDSPWGRIRMEMGHPKPFGLDMIGIGNEQWETEKVDFFNRYELFQQAIHQKYPKVKIIGSAGPDISSKHYDDAWKYYYKNTAENSNFVYAVDEHYYVKPEWLCENIHFYDKYPRNVKVFAGEYAAHYSSGMNAPYLNSWGAALAEAAFLTGIERNADVVVLASYAPLLARLGYAQWSPNMIWFDGERSYGSPSYYVQLMYSTLMGTNLLKVNYDKEVIPFTVSCNKEERIIYIKLVNITDQEIRVTLNIDFNLEEYGEVYWIQGNKDDINSIDHPLNIAPLRRELKKVSTEMDYEVAANSFHVIKLNYKE